MDNPHKKIWIPIGFPGYLGERALKIHQFLNDKFGKSCWRFSHSINGKLVTKEVAIIDYEKSYRLYFQDNPWIFSFLIEEFGNVYDYDIKNVYDLDYWTKNRTRNHYHDICIRKIVQGFSQHDYDNPIKNKICSLMDLTSLKHVRIPRAVGFHGKKLLQIRGPESPGFFLSPSVIPFHTPGWIVVNPLMNDWYLKEGCGPYSVEAFWQSTKLLEVRFDKYIKMSREEKLSLYSSLKLHR